MSHINQNLLRDQKFQFQRIRETLEQARDGYVVAQSNYRKALEVLESYEGGYFLRNMNDVVKILRAMALQIDDQAPQLEEGARLMRRAAEDLEEYGRKPIEDLPPPPPKAEDGLRMFVVNRAGGNG